MGNLTAVVCAEAPYCAINLGIHWDAFNMGCGMYDVLTQCITGKVGRCGGQGAGGLPLHTA
jgi:hypothetical protein